jgi:hypothetical protein
MRHKLLTAALSATVLTSLSASAQNPGQIIVTTPTGNELIALQTAGPQSAAISATNLAIWVNGGGGGGSPGVFSTLSASSTVSGTGFTARFATPGPIGNTVASTGAFTTLAATTSANLTTSGTVTINPTTAGAIDNAAIGANTASTGAFTTLAASGAVSGTGFTNLFASPPAIGGTAAAAGKFTTLQYTTSAGLTVAVSTDSGQTATATLCEDTTSHVVYFGSGTGGICKGTSSMRFKEHISGLGDGLSKVMGLQPVVYYPKPGYGDPDKPLYGLLAEDVAKVLPKVAEYDAQGAPSSVDYIGVIPVLINAIKEQQAEITRLKRKAHIR